MNQLGQQICAMDSFVAIDDILNGVTLHPNDEETLEEYIRDTESTFNLERKELKELSDGELNDYVKYLDTLW